VCCTVRGGAGVFDTGVSLLALSGVFLVSQLSEAAARQLALLSTASSFPQGPILTFRCCLQRRGTCIAQTNERGRGGRDSWHLQLCHAVPSLSNPKSGVQEPPHCTARLLPVATLVSPGILLAELGNGPSRAEVVVLAPSRAGSSRQAGAEALSSLPGLRRPLPWKAAGGLQNRHQHLFFFFILTCAAVLGRVRNQFWKRLQ